MLENDGEGLSLSTPGSIGGLVGYSVWKFGSFASIACICSYTSIFESALGFYFHNRCQSS